MGVAHLVILIALRLACSVAKRRRLLGSHAPNTLSNNRADGRATSSGPATDDAAIAEDPAAPRARAVRTSRSMPAFLHIPRLAASNQPSRSESGRQQSAAHSPSLRSPRPSSQPAAIQFAAAPRHRLVQRSDTAAGRRAPGVMAASGLRLASLASVGRGEGGGGGGVLQSCASEALGSTRG
jgi:hypothetical protein